MKQNNFEILEINGRQLVFCSPSYAETLYDSKILDISPVGQATTLSKEVYEALTPVRLNTVYYDYLNSGKYFLDPRDSFMSFMEASGMTKRFPKEPPFIFIIRQDFLN
ncbi:gp202 [Sphingomonas phage PAU]|uniref:gp202 n=1 Tax=Sphingomonas phage PAU TaxID=1150991 RepID=UPI0002573368|nr:gp202 [Sphingomonas phage PAU]AFF28200.1 gp202 [Sphingomonas phage PAU]